MGLPNEPGDLIQTVDTFRKARRVKVPAKRLQAMRSAAQELRSDMLAGPKVAYYRSIGLVRVPYPTRYAFLNAATKLRTPFVHIFNRLFIVQVRSGDGLKTLLLSPSDVDRNAATPYFERLNRGFGKMQNLGRRVVAPVENTVESALAEAGIDPAQIDYISFDHLHTQDLRHWLGGTGFDAYFPNARLLVMREEWDAMRGLAPPQKDWYCPDGAAGIPAEKIVVLDQDVMVGEGLALIKTPGHTMGNHSFVAHTDDGLLVTSENGVGPDSYAPEHSQIPGLKQFAESRGMEVVLNGNTLESGLEQYISMVVEKEIAGPSPHDPRFPNIASSSELTRYWMFPGCSPSFNLGDREYGQLRRAKSQQDSAAAVGDVCVQAG